MQAFLNLGALVSLLLAVALGGVVGIEREKTHMLVCLGACLYTIISIDFSSTPSQIAAGIVAGVGFIGAGTIWAEKDRFKALPLRQAFGQQPPSV